MLTRGWERRGGEGEALEWEAHICWYPASAMTSNVRIVHFLCDVSFIDVKVFLSELYDIHSYMLSMCAHVCIHIDVCASAHAMYANV